MSTWIACGAVIIGRGQPPPGRTPEAQQAEAQLWSTHNIDQR